MRDRHFSPTNPSLVVGAISAAATSGALVAIGHRMGHAGAAFAAIASDARPRGVVFGLAIHTAVVFFWSAVAVRLGQRFRSQAVAALIVSVANFLVATMVASWAGRGVASELTLGDRVIYAIVLTVSLI
ncbi:MAG: hypothetical protein ACREPM_21400, partial [Gemmatimonadaceae bacterium]